MSRPWFRPSRGQPTEAMRQPAESASILALLADVIDQRHFTVSADLQLEWDDREVEECLWEVFQGRLLEPGQTRQTACFTTWSVRRALTGEPLLALRLDADRHICHVVRGLECRVWEGYDAGNAVILSREVPRWVLDLVGSVSLSDFDTLDELRDELICLLFHAVVGTSRLPIASLETPLPAFALGQLFYCYKSEESRVSSEEANRRLEFDLRRSAPGAAILPARQEWKQLLALMQGVSLSPYLDFGQRLLGAVRQFRLDEQIDFCSQLLILLGRHLTAYDLTTFHYRGANYPDALLLDEVLRFYLNCIEQKPELFLDALADNPLESIQRKRRRALRQAFLLRKHYEGHAVPDVPTSPGDNRRIVSGQARVPDEQILQPETRQRMLYRDEALEQYLGPNCRRMLRASMADLEQPAELLELGLALYLDRPLGDAKAATEPDRTPLLSSLAYSQTITRQRLHALRHDPLLQGEEERWLRLEALLPTPAGVRVGMISPPRRPATVSLSDARRAAVDFVFLRTLSSGLKTLFAWLHLDKLEQNLSLDWLLHGRILLARSPGGDRLAVYNDLGQERLELAIDERQGFVQRANQEFPRAGLWVLRIDEKRLEPPIHLPLVD